MSHRELIDSLIKDGYLKTPRIIDAFKKIDRADFVPDDLKHEAYVNAPLPIGHGQTISQPLTVAFMLELLAPQEGDKVLDVGAGSGWQTAILAQIVGKKGKVFAIEILEKLAEFGKNNLEKYKFLSSGRVEFIRKDASFGLPENAPYERIIAAAAGNEIPPAWKEQLKINGRLVAPVRNSIFSLIKKAEDQIEETEYPGFAFVPLLSESEKGQEWKKYFQKSDEQNH